MRVGSRVFIEKPDAGNAILEACKVCTKAEEEPLGHYRGFDMSLSFEPFRKEFELILHGSMSHHVSLGTDARGNITRIDNALSGITEKLEKTQEKLAVTLQQVEDAKAEVAKEFPQEQELREKSARLAELDAILNMDGGGESMEELESEDRDADAASEVRMLSEESVNYGICDPKAGNARPSVLDELRSKSARIPACKSGRYTEEVL